ncbi:MAG: flagellar M-ring protein FliF [Candidatus Aminicenantes bacterium]|nr:MAG: flagellar M-ring protein FliF [Candidatus Aminicenantes bacterium]
MMGEERTDALGKIKNFLNRFTLSRKIFLGSVILLSIVGIILVINLVTALNYGVLYSNLSSKDSGLILERLKAKKVSYKLSDGGSIIKVPENQAAELRLELAAAGLPEGKTSISTGDFLENINYIRAIEGELARTISQFKEVTSAKVHITLPKRSGLIDEQEESKASIVLNLSPGARVSGTIVPAVLHLTAQSVEGLKPENIAIIDVNGNILSRPGTGEEDMFTGLTTSQIAYQGKMEKSLARKIIALLEPSVGVGKIRADVKLMLNFDKIETTEEKVDPDSIVKVSEESEITSSPVAEGAGGTPAAPAKSKSEKSSTNYEISKKITRLTKPVGEIQRISAAVVVDDAVDVQLQDGKLIKRTRKRTPEELEAIKKIARAAVGFNSQRGDVIEVANLPFDTSAETVSQYYHKKQKSKDLIDSLIKYGAYALGFILLIFVILKPLVKKIKEIVKDALSPKPAEVEIPRLESEKLLALQEAKDEAEIEQELLEKYKIPKTAKKMGIIRDRVKKFAAENVDEAAALVKSFLIEDKRKR